MRKLIALLGILLLTAQAFAQTRVVTGVVKDPAGNPVPGISITFRDYNKGTATGADGSFSISVPSSVKRMIVSGVNIEPLTVNIQNRTGLGSVVVTHSSTIMQEVVVTAYGTQKKSEISSAISTVNAEAIKDQQITTVGQALQGTAPGVMVVNTNGQPGSDPVIRIRGVASIAASADPLIVLDGIPYDGDLAMLNPADIENFTVLKDASATALYGSRAANGVILINTKAGRRNAAPSITLSATYGISKRAVADYPYLNTQQQFELSWEALKNAYAGGGDPNAPGDASQTLISTGFHYNPYGPAFPNPVGADGKLAAGATPLWNDNWTKALETNNPGRSDINLGVSGGTDKSRYYMSLGYLAQDGYVIRSNYKRLSATLNYTTNLTDWLQVGARTNIVSSTQNYPDQGSGDYADVVQFGRTMSSVFPIYARNDSGQIIKDINGNPQYDYGKPDPSRTVNVNRPVLQLANDVGTVNLDQWNYDRLLTNLTAFTQVNFTKAFYFKSTIGVNRTQLNELSFQNKDFGDAASVGGRTYEEDDLTTSWTWNNMLGFEKHFGAHHIDAMVSYEAYKFDYNTMYGSKTGFPFDGQTQLSDASTNEDFEGYTVSSTLLSELARIRYDYKARYFLEVSGRRDGSSIFAPGYREGTFPAAGASWLISEENFMRPVTWINALKIRASVGSVGNNELLTPGTTGPGGNNSTLAAGGRSYFPYLSTYSAGYNDLTNSGVYLSQLVNNQIQWEKQLSSNIGIDFELFKSRFTGSIDYFVKTSNHLIITEPLTPSIGFSSYPANIGKLQNKGVEFNLNYAIIRSRDFDWNVSLNLTTLKNVIKELLPGEDTFATQGAFRKVVGKSIYEYYLPVWAGVDPTNGSGQWWIPQTDANGNPTGKQTTTDDYTTALTAEKWVGSGIPKVTGGFTTRFRYKNLDLSVLFNYQFGGKYYDGNYAGLMEGTYSGFGAQMDVDELKRWNTPGQITNVPILNPSNDDPEQLSTRFLFSDDYIRLRDVTLGYTVRPLFIKKVVKSFRIYVQADNIWTWDKLKKGSDPESSIDGQANGNAFPFKTYSAGVDFNF